MKEKIQRLAELILDRYVTYKTVRGEIPFHGDHEKQLSLLSPGTDSRILIRDYEDYNYLKKFGDTYYLPIDGSTEKDAEGVIRQGYTEQSNVQVVNEMVNLIAITRAYEAGQKVIRSVDSTIELAVSSLGKV